MSTPIFTLNTGAKIPAVAFGTYGAEDKEIYDAVIAAINAGYRHIDAAYFYQNEPAVGKAIRDSKIPREELFVVTKMWPTQAADPQAALDNSLKNLGLDYVDLYLVHWPIAVKPNPDEEFSWGLGIDESIDYIDTWAKFQKLPKSQTKAIGVSNFTSKKLERLLNAPSTTVVPAANQCEFHPNLPQQKLVDYCKSKGIICEAYSPLARGQVNDPVVQRIAKETGADAGQVILSWNVQRGVIVLPKSVTPSRIASNLKVIELSEQQVKDLTALGSEKWNRIGNPAKNIGGYDMFDNDIDCK